MIFKKEFTYLLSFAMVMTNTPMLFANEVGTASFQKTIDDSKEINSTFNAFFQKRLTSNGNKNYSSDAHHYLLGLPRVDQAMANSQTSQNCDLNKYENISENELKIAVSKKRDITQAYCNLQESLSGLTTEQIPDAVIANENDADKEAAYQQTLNRLQNKDTLVVIIPGIFGEFIEQIAFGEVFGQGLRSQNPTSSFAKEFDDYITVNGLKQNPKNTQGQSKRFLVKNLSRLKSDNDDKSKLFDAIPVDQWMKVSSVDMNGKPLFKVAVFGLESMSLESLGHQEELAVLYNKRLGQFLNLYKNLGTHKLPDNIIFVGYSRGAPIAMEMLSILKNGQRPGQDRFADLKNQIKADSAEWFPKVKSLVSLGGVIYGSALGDASLIYRKDAPFNVRFIQEFKRVMFQLEVINEEDIRMAGLGAKSAITATYPKTNTGIVTVLASEAKQNLLPLLSKIKNNVNILTSFSDIIQKESQKASQMSASEIQQIKKIVGFISALKLDGTSLSTVAGINAFVQNYLENINGLISASSNMLPDLMAMNKFTSKIANNFGFVDIGQTIATSIKNQDFVAVVNELNNLIRYFSFYFKAVWNGASELGTIERLNWMSEYASLLPTENMTYYSMIGILGQNSSPFYNQGLNYGYNYSSDEVFLDKSWNDLRSVGTNDGLDLTFAGSKLNDSQVDWYKTVVWPDLTQVFTGKKFKAKILGVARTHHWGLALPYAFLNKEVGLEPKPVVNPFPRGELLESIVMTIDSDLNVVAPVQN